LRLVAGVAMALLYVSVAAMVAPREALVALVLSSLYLMANAVGLDWAVKGMERFHLSALASATSAAMTLLGFVALVRVVPEPATATGVWAGAFLAGAGVLHLTLGRGRGGYVRPVFRPSSWRRHLKASLFFAVSGALLSAIQYAPVLTLTLQGHFGDLGHFSAAARLVTVAMSAGFLLPMAIYPTLSRSAVGSNSDFRSAARRLQGAMLLLGLVGGSTLYFVSRPLIELLYGTPYAASVPVLRVLAWIVPVVFLRYSLGSVLLAAGHQHRHTLSSLIGFVVTASGCALTLHRAGGVAGVSLSWLVGEAVVAGLMACAWLAADRRAAHA
jgi:PST family polysaccharide transporter